MAVKSIEVPAHKYSTEPFAILAVKPAHFAPVASFCAKPVTERRELQRKESTKIHRLFVDIVFIIRDFDLKKGVFWRIPGLIGLSQV